MHSPEALRLSQKKNTLLGGFNLKELHGKRCFISWRKVSHTEARPVNDAAPISIYITIICSCTASNGLAPARIMPVIAPGS